MDRVVAKPVLPMLLVLREMSFSLDMKILVDIPMVFGGKGY